MIHPHEAIRKFIELKKGLFENMTKETLASLEKIQWDNMFWTACKNRMIQGAYRYSDQNVQKFQMRHTDNVRYIKEKIRRYEQDGNVEHLFDIANATMIEFGFSYVVNQNFSPQDDVGHARKK